MFPILHTAVAQSGKSECTIKYTYRVTMAWGIVGSLPSPTDLRLVSSPFFDPILNKAENGTNRLQIT